MGSLPLQLRLLPSGLSLDPSVWVSSQSLSSACPALREGRGMRDSQGAQGCRVPNTAGLWAELLQPDLALPHSPRALDAAQL